MHRTHMAGENQVPRIVLKYVPYTHIHHHYHPKMLVKKYVSKALRECSRFLSLLFQFLDIYSQDVNEVCKDKSIENTL